MIKKISSLALLSTSALMMSQVQAGDLPPVSNYIKIETSVTGYNDLAKKGFGGGETLTTYRPTFTLSPKYSFTPDFRVNTGWRDGGKNSSSLSFEKMDFNLEDKDFGTFYGKKVKLLYQLGTPVKTSQQLEGRMLTFTVRPSVTYDVSGFSTVVRNSFQFPVQRQATQSNYPKDDIKHAVKGNPLYTNTFELIATSPEFLTSGLTFTAYLGNNNSYKGATKAGATNFWDSVLAQDLGFGYTSAAISNFELELGTAFNTKYGQKSSGTDNKTEWWSVYDTSFYFNVGKSF